MPIRRATVIEQELVALAKAIREAVTKYKAENRVPMQRQVRIRRRDFTLKYHEDFAFANFGSDRIEEDIWDLEDQILFGNSIIEHFPEYKSLVSALGGDAGHPFPAGFVRSLVGESFQGLSDKQITERANTFARQVACLPIKVDITAFIDGLSIVESPIVISDFLTLRRPVPEDFAEYVRLDEYGGFSFPQNQTWFRSIGQFVFNAASTGIAQTELHRTIGALRLFRVGGVAANRYGITAQDSFLQGAIGVMSSPGRPSQHFYTLSASDAASLNTFLRDIAPLTPDPFQPAADTAAEREIAYMRYNDALFQDGPPERTITSAVTALEALFLTHEPELRHRLAQRVSVFLRALGSQTDALSTYEKVSKGYRIRSAFIHGGSLKAKDRPHADQLAPVLLEYARASVLAFFQMATPKAELLKHLDRAMIDPAGVRELQDSLTAVVHK